MKKRRILIVVMSLVIAFVMVGCDDGGPLLAKATANEENGFKKIENTEESIFELGAKQTKEIKDILDKYEVKNVYNNDNTDGTIVITKDKDDGSLEGARGYNISTNKYVKVNDGGDHQYQVLYKAYVDIANNNTPRYLYQIVIGYPEKEKFKLDNFKMFKELVQEVQGSDYDFATLDKTMSKLEKKKKGELENDAGSFHEIIESDENIFGENTNDIVFSFSLRE